MKDKITVRKIVLLILLLIAIFFCYEVLFGNIRFIRNTAKSIPELKQSASKLRENSNKINDITLEEKQKEIAKAIESYQKTKAEYDELVDTISAERLKDIEESDVYDVGFLWTIIGNYATEEGIGIRFFARANDVETAKNSPKSYAPCNLQFTVAGEYINLTDFLYDLEDDDRLAFEINEFKMTKNDKTVIQEGDLQVTLKVREINLYKDNLTEDGVYWITKAP